MTRLQRHQTDPVLKGERFRPKYTLMLNDSGLLVRYHRSRWDAVADNDEGVRRRVTRAKLLANGEHAGSIKFVDYEIPSHMSADEFLEEMDDHSAATSELAEVLCANWEEPTDLGEYGNVIELNRAWMRPSHSSGGRFKAAVDVLLMQHFSDRSLLILKAFPLEYEGDLTDANRDYFRTRQRAMMRHYRQLFGVLPVPGARGREGWMYAVPDRLSGLLTPPAESQ